MVGVLVFSKDRKGHVELVERKPCSRHRQSLRQVLPPLRDQRVSWRRRGRRNPVSDRLLVDPRVEIHVLMEELDWINV